MAWQSELSLPYLRGFIISFLLKEMKPSDLKVAPDELFPTERVRDVLEWSLLRNWMKDWLRYVHWYWSVANSPDVSLSDFFSASVYEKEWRIRREPSELIRFGLLWKIYDLVAEKGVAWSPPCLQEHLPGFRGWLLGGVSCMDFLVERLTRLERNHRI